MMENPKYQEPLIGKILEVTKKKDLSILYKILNWYPSYQIIVKYKIHNYSTILYVSDVLYEKGNNS